MKKNNNMHTNEIPQNKNPTPLPSDLITRQTQPILNSQPSLSTNNQSISNRKIQVNEQCMQLNNNSFNPDKDTFVNNSPLPPLDFSNLYLDTLVDVPYFPSKDEIEKVKAKLLQQFDL